MEASGLIIESCKSMDSKKVPLWLVWKNAEPIGKPILVIFKAGDDLRQDLLTLQMIRIMDKVHERERERD
jgi:phosphatidylinositol kinase/protein kinase (PI-3  family)